jgi:uncharacterized protein YbjQ (UPF0145 family)
MLLAAGNINQPYKVLGVIHVVITREQTRNGCGTPTGLPVQEAYDAAANALGAAAKKSSANGVIHICYDYRLSATSYGCNSTRPVFEVYGWGTAVTVDQ